MNISPLIIGLATAMFGYFIFILYLFFSCIIVPMELWDYKKLIT